MKPIGERLAYVVLIARLLMQSAKDFGVPLTWHEALIDGAYQMNEHLKGGTDG